MLITRFNPSLALIFLVVFLTGCAGGTYSKTSKRPAVKPGSYVQINHEYQIPNEFARVYFRNGKQTLKGDIDRFTPHCFILMQNIRQAGQPQQIIFPGRFNVTKVIERNDHAFGRTTYAALTFEVFDGPSNVDYQLEMRLSSGEQPGVRALICVKNADDYFDRRYPNLSEIKIALGDLVTIDAPGQ
ncbi:MAG: hypothetical protein GY896_05510 [Gammaproteobacteria bacterium]|nr:hypothetical protein [Gammaproteobacteria bacterium]